MRAGRGMEVVPVCAGGGRRDKGGQGHETCDHARRLGRTSMYLSMC